MTFLSSLTKVKSKKIFLAFFALASLIPILIVVLFIYYYLLPNFEPDKYETIYDTLYIGLSIMILFPLLSFFLMYRWLDSLENITTEIVSKTAEVAQRQKEFKEQTIEHKNDYIESSIEVQSSQQEANEIQSLIQSFNAIFHTAADQLEERNHLRDLLANLIGVASKLTSELDFDRLFPLIIGNVTDTMSAERTSLYVIDWDRREIWTKVSEGIEQIRLPLGRGISGRVAETGKSINVVDAWELPYYDRSYDQKNNFRTRSVLCVPILGRSGINIGVLQVINKKGKDQFDEEDEVFLTGLASQVGIALENSLLVDEIRLSFSSSVSTLSAVVDSRHPFTAGHSERVMEYSLLIAREMQLSEDEIESLKYAALLHDIGKIGISDKVLMKNGPYTPEDWIEMKSHPLKTKAILDKFHFPRKLCRVPEIACRHHEKINGDGYPDGLTGNQLPLDAKILALADVFDALTSQRDYPKYAFGKTLDHNPMPLNQVIALLKNQAGTHFDPSVVNAFLRCLPQALTMYRGSFFQPEYVDDTIRTLRTELLPR